MFNKIVVGSCIQLKALNVKIVFKIQTGLRSVLNVFIRLSLRFMVESLKRLVTELTQLCNVITITQNEKLWRNSEKHYL